MSTDTSSTISLRSNKFRYPQVGRLSLAAPGSLALATMFSLFACSSSNGQELDEYGGFTDIKGDAPGFFRAQKLDIQ